MYKVCGLRTFATEEDAEAREVSIKFPFKRSTSCDMHDMC